VDEKEKVQIANFLCPVSLLWLLLLFPYWGFLRFQHGQTLFQGNYAVSGGVKGIEAVEAKAKSFKARMTVSVPMHLFSHYGSCM
jgi:hypothetical protein